MAGNPGLSNPMMLIWRPWQVRQHRTFPIGKLVDSDDDTARLMIITQYAGSQVGEGVC